MSGIFGLTGEHGRAHVASMAQRLSHRGSPTDQVDNTYVRGGGVGARATCAASRDGRWTALVDGSLYNRDALAAKPPPGSLARNAPPAALVLALYQAHGPEGLEAIDGDFAAVLYDSEARTVTLSRDFFGCRPLYYTILPRGGIAFASEYKALLALPMVDPQPDLDMLQHLQSAKKLPVGRTLFANIHAAPPGVLVLDERGNEKARHAFAPLKVDVTVHSEDQAKDLLLSSLREAIVRRTRDLDRIGLALSGGIDSIGTAFLLRSLLPEKPLFTFTAGSHAQDAEILTAAAAVRELGSTHQQVVTPPTLLLDTLPSLVWHLEDPYSRTESLQLWKVGEAAAGKVDVLFSGQGADSLYAGMPKYMLLALMKRLPPLRGGLREFYTYTQLGLPPKSLTGRLLQFAKFRGSLPPVPRVRGGTLPPPIQFPPVDDQFINRIMARGFQAGSSQDIQKFERPFSAFGLVYRSPFHDLGLVRSAYTITDDLKIRGMNQKYILRRALESVMPPRFLELKKFPQRMNADEAFSRSLDQVADEVLSRARVESRGFFSPDDISRLRGARRNGRYHPEAAARLWTAILTELWAQRFIDEKGAPPVASTPAEALSSVG